MYYPCIENKGPDQLHGYREADLRLCFRICKKLVFSRRCSNNVRNIMRKPIFSKFPTNSDTNRAVQSQKMVRGLKFFITKEEVLYYLRSENNDADQLHSNHAADLRLLLLAYAKSWRWLFHLVGM